VSLFIRATKHKQGGSPNRGNRFSCVELRWLLLLLSDPMVCRSRSLHYIQPTHGPGARQYRSTKNAPSGANPAPARRLTPEDGDSGAAVEKCLLRLRLQTATATGAQEERTDDDHQSPRASRTQGSLRSWSIWSAQLMIYSVLLSTGRNNLFPCSSVHANRVARLTLSDYPQCVLKMIL
jgi:hypothetical protein